MKRVAISQSNYIPWKGYFDMIAFVDEFILFDDMQYTRRDWRNRNQIKTPAGLQWLTVPVKVKGRYTQTIRETEIDEAGWAAAHWNRIIQSYRKAAHFEEAAVIFEPLYRNARFEHLSDLNEVFLRAICAYLGISTPITHSWDYSMIDGRTHRLADLCAQAGGTEYVSGPAARTYIEETIFAERNLSLRWFDYNDYPSYPQLWGEFTHGVSILDLIFNCGRDASQYMRFVDKRGSAERPSEIFSR